MIFGTFVGFEFSALITDPHITAPSNCFSVLEHNDLDCYCRAVGKRQSKKKTGKPFYRKKQRSHVGQG